MYLYIYTVWMWRLGGIYSWIHIYSCWCRGRIFFWFADCLKRWDCFFALAHSLCLAHCLKTFHVPKRDECRKTSDTSHFATSVARDQTHLIYTYIISWDTRPISHVHLDISTLQTVSFTSCLSTSWSLNVSLNVLVFECVSECVSHLCLTVCVNECECMWMCVNVCECVWMYVTVSRGTRVCLNMCVNVCEGLWISVNICECVQMCANVCGHVLMYANVCMNVSQVCECVWTCVNVSECVYECVTSLAPVFQFVAMSVKLRDTCVHVCAVCICVVCGYMSWHMHVSWHLHLSWVMTHASVMSRPFVLSVNVSCNLPHSCASMCVCKWVICVRPCVHVWGRVCMCEGVCACVRACVHVWDTRRLCVNLSLIKLSRNVWGGCGWECVCMRVCVDACQCVTRQAPVRQCVIDVS